VHRIESAFNVWGHLGPEAEPAAPAPDAAAPAAALPDTGLPDTGPPDTASPGTALPGTALPGIADPGQPASTAPSTRDWVPHAAARLRDADLLPGADLQPAADLLDPADDLADQDLLRRPPAPRRSGPAPGWNPDSEEDWLRVLRGLRASEDG
jgi:hypothetical protein